MGLKAIASRLHFSKSYSHNKKQQHHQQQHAPQQHESTRSSPQLRLAQLQHVKQLAPALYGQVWLCRDTGANANSAKVAVKTVNLLAAQRQQTVREGVPVREDVHKERRVHAMLRKRRQSDSSNASSNVLLVQEEIEFKGVLYMVFDFCAAGDLLDVVKRSPRGRLDERTCRSFLRDVARGLQFLHRAGFAHRDISLENVLVTSRGECKLSDFGLVCDISCSSRNKKTANQRVGKAWYMAPEVYACTGTGDNSTEEEDGKPETETDEEDGCYDPVQADIWSLGILFVIMLTGAPLLHSASVLDRRFQFILQNGPQALFSRSIVTEKVSPEAQDLICRMLQVTPEKRISLDAVLEHPFFSATPTQQ